MLKLINMADVPNDSDDDQPGFTNQTTFERQISNVIKRNGVDGNNSPACQE